MSNTMKTVTIGGTTITVSPETYEHLVKTNREIAMQDAFERRDFVTYEKLKSGSKS